MDYKNIQIEDLYYDRTRNLSGIEEFEDFADIACPSEGSFVEFSSKDTRIETDNNYLNIIPVGINNLVGKFNMAYETTEGSAQKIVNFIEEKKGIEPVFFDTDPTIYKKVNGFCTNYNLSQIDADNYLVELVFDVTEAPNHFSWTGLNFLDPDQGTTSYRANRWDYKKNDVVYDQREESIYKDKLNNFYYCVKDHNSSDDTSDYLKDSNYFTQDFFWTPDVGQSSSVNMTISEYGEKQGFPTRRKTKDNTAIFPLEYQFKNITTKELKSMLHFLESKGGYRRFKHQIAGVYNRPKIFVCRKWKHSWNTFDSHTLQVTLEEDPLGVYPKRSDVRPEDVSSRAVGFNGEVEVVGNIPANWIANDGSYRDLNIGVSCLNIGAGAFSGCSGLIGSVVIPSSVTALGDGSFYECSGITNLILGRGLDTIGANSFRGCSLLEGDLAIPDVTRYVGSSAFEYCSSLNGELTLGYDLTGIGSKAFRGCFRLGGELVLPSGLLEIGSYAFANTDVFGRVYIPDTVIDIQDRAFQNCSFIGNTITIESGVQSMGAYVFNNCSSIQRLKFKGQQAPTSVSINAFKGLENLNTRNGNKIIYAPIGGQGYDIAPWNDFEIIYER
tara:strand:+ start:851 stop:2683 length:1833 start_codon:yes stop_codon:yes gene_type:complete